MFISNNKALSVIVFSLLGQDARASLLVRPRGLEDSCTECTLDSKRGTDYTFTETGIFPGTDDEITVSITNFANPNESSAATLVETSDSTSHTAYYQNTDIGGELAFYSLTGESLLFGIEVTTDPTKENEIVSWDANSEYSIPGTMPVSLAYIGCICPTEAPTASPTEAPTASPTEAPTASPTEASTASPTTEENEEEDDDCDCDCCEENLFSFLQSLFIRSKI